MGYPCRVFFFPCSKPCSLRRRVVLKQMDGRAVTVRETREEEDVKGRRKKEQEQEQGSCNIRTPTCNSTTIPSLQEIADCSSYCYSCCSFDNHRCSNTISNTLIHYTSTTHNSFCSFSAALPTTCNPRHCTSALKEKKKKIQQQKANKDCCRR